MPVDRILVIEDNAANLELMTYLLRAYQYETFSAVDGAAGVDLARLERPDVIVCDVQMPKKDGFEVVRELKADPVTRAIPVVAVTALAMVGDRERVIAAGFDGYIGKPISPETFVAQVEQFVRRRSSGRPAPAPAAAQPAHVTRLAEASGVRILVVDNTEANIDFLVGLLAPLGYEVETASNVAAAFARARERVPDLIISDVHMPGEGGLDLLARVKADALLRQVPFLLVSATSWDENSGREAACSGADLFLMRPMDPQRLLEHIRRLLEERG